MKKIVIDLNNCHDKVQLINFIYDSLSIITPRGINWDALEENLNNIQNTSEIRFDEHDLFLKITGLNGLYNRLGSEDVNTLQDILIKATNSKNRIDGLNMYISLNN